MTETSNADKLHIGEGFVVWIIGASVEETSILDPLPEGAETIERRSSEAPDDEDHERDDRRDDEDHDDERRAVDAAVLVTDNRTALIDDLDEVVPQLGSIEVVWVTYPLVGADVDEETIQTLLADYGWEAIESIALDDTWAAMRIQQS